MVGGDIRGCASEVRAAICSRLRGRQRKLNQYFFDDEQMLAELFRSIDDVNAKLEAGIFSLASEIKDTDIRTDDLKFDSAYEQITILFLRPEYEHFIAVLQEVEADLKNAATIGICDYEQFEKYREMVREVSKRYDVRNIAAIMARITQIVRDALKNKREKP